MSDKEMFEAADRAVDVLQQMGDQLAALLREALELYERAECVGPTRQERARINEIRKMMSMPPMREDYGP